MRHDHEYVSIPHVVRSAARRFGDALALVDGDARWSFRTLEERMVEAVKAAMAAGVRPGDRVGLCAPNSKEWILAALGIQGAGGIVVPLNTRFKAGEQAYILRTCGATALFASSFLGSDYIAALREAAPDLPALATTVSILGPQGAADRSWPQFVAGGADIADADAHAAIDRLTPDDIADVIFTSGTTGNPKGVILTHGQSLRAYGWMAAEYTFAPSDTILVIGNFRQSSDSPHGRTSVSPTGRSVYDYSAGLGRQPNLGRPTAGLAGSQVCGADVRPMGGSPSLAGNPGRQPAVKQKARPAREGIPRIQLGEEVNPPFFHRLSRLQGQRRTRVVHARRDGCGPHRGSGVPGHRGAARRRRRRGRVYSVPGEILVRGFNVTRGYWADPEATAAAIDADGWLHTGDVGRFDEAGNLAVVDRKKEMFIVGGFNAYPAEIEKLLLAYEPIGQVAVIGVPDERMGEVGCAFVVPRPGRGVSADQVIAWARANMANFKVPRHVRLVGELPRNASQKILKQELRARFAEGG